MSVSSPPGREVQLRDTMDELIGIVSGERFDLGEPFGYMRAVVKYGGFEL